MDGQNGGQDALREAFVEMLFALAVSEIAIHAAEIVSASGSVNQKIPAGMHLTVGLILIATSWVGWRRSVSPGMRERVNSCFSIPFLGLLLDVFLVILYFIIVKLVEIEQKDGRVILTAPTARPEASWLCVVFMTYALWDILADVLSEGCLPRMHSWLHRINTCMSIAVTSTFASLFCLVLAFSAMLIGSKSRSPVGVELLDLSLICIILLFRASKVVEDVMAPFLGVSDCKAFKQKRAIRGNEWVWCVSLLFGFLLLVTLASMT